MNEIISALTFHIYRSEIAYSYYLKEQKFFQALRIYEANKEIYNLITAHGYLWKDEHVEIIKYLHHLEDWFVQFDFLVLNNNPSPNDTFVFNRYENAIAYPKNIIHTIKGIRK